MESSRKYTLIVFNTCTREYEEVTVWMAQGRYLRNNHEQSKKEHFRIYCGKL